MNTAKLTIRLPPGELDFAKSYAKGHGISLTGLIHRYFARLKRAEEPSIPKEVASITGILPKSIDARDEYAAYIESKHR